MTFQRLKTTIPVPSAVTNPAHIPATWLTLPKTKRSAERQGLPWYFWGGKPCANGHYSIRRIDRGECPQCERDRMRERRERHPATNIGE